MLKLFSDPSGLSPRPEHPAQAPTGAATAAQDAHQPRQGQAAGELDPLALDGEGQSPVTVGQVDLQLGDLSGKPQEIRGGAKGEVKRGATIGDCRGSR